MTTHSPIPLPNRSIKVQHRRQQLLASMPPEECKAYIGICWYIARYNAHVPAWMRISA
jgi:hypothetical protein